MVGGLDPFNSKTGQRWRDHCRRKSLEEERPHEERLDRVLTHQRDEGIRATKVAVILTMQLYENGIKPDLKFPSSIPPNLKDRYLADVIAWSSRDYRTERLARHPSHTEEYTKTVIEVINKALNNAKNCEYFLQEERQRGG